MSIIPPEVPGPAPGQPGHFNHHDWLAAAVKALESFAVLPDPVTARSSTTAVVGNSWTDIPNCFVALDLPSPAWVLCMGGGWLRSIAPGTDVRMGIDLSGATVLGPTGVGGAEWGWTGINSSEAETVGGNASRIALFQPGITIVKLQGYGTSGTTAQVNYATIAAIPLRWASS